MKKCLLDFIRIFVICVEARDVESIQKVGAGQMYSGASS